MNELVVHGKFNIMNGGNKLHINDFITLLERGE